jgi:hypothetical protein
VFTEGTLNGQLTVGAQHNVVVTDDLTYTPGTESVLGLVAYKFVQIYHPVKSCSSGGSCRNGGQTLAGPSGTLGDITVQALLMSSQDSFMVQQWDKGLPLGTLTIKGGIIQRFRGAVATTSSGSIYTGYAKNYLYDARLKYQIPPHFVAPDTVTWGVNIYGEQKPKTTFTAPASPYTGTAGLYSLT